jgi:predicted lipoprotein with Yx(FWY)xxD motif
MPIRAIPLIAVLILLLGACAQAPSATPSPAVSATPTAAPATPTQAPVATPTAAPAATPTAEPTAAATQPREPGYDDDYSGGNPRPGATPPPTGDGATLEVADAGHLMGPADRALYTFSNDEPGVSNCSGTCAQSWPPLIVEAGAEPTAGEGVDGTLGTIERADGSRQVTYDDQPLYYYAGDTGPDDTTGDGVNDVWFLARP